MSLADAFRRAADAGRKAAAAVAQRPVSVAVYFDTYSAAPDTAGATVLSSVPTTLSPNPHVVFAADAASVFGGGLRSGPNANLTAGQVRIGPITPAYAGGGYDPATLLPTPTDATQRVYLKLAGNGLAAGGEYYDIDRVEAEKAQSWFIVATRTTQTILAG